MTTDGDFANFNNFSSSFLEVSLGVLATCIATYRPLFSKAHGKVSSWFQSSDLQSGNEPNSQTAAPNAEAPQAPGIQLT
jgi:hypothetical protein